jgi:hypothetical protein
MMGTAPGGAIELHPRVGNGTRVGVSRGRMARPRRIEAAPDRRQEGGVIGGGVCPGKVIQGTPPWFS